MPSDTCAFDNRRVTHVAVYNTKGGKRVDRLCEPCAREFQKRAGYDKVTLYTARDNEGEQ